MTPTPWPEILSQPWDEPSDEYGPHTHAVWNALDCLSHMPKLDGPVRELLASDESIRAVSSWDEAMQMFADVKGEKYGPNGHLIEPVRRVRTVIDSVTWDRSGKRRVRTSSST